MITLDKITEEMLDTIQMLKNNNNPDASECEKIDVAKAEAIQHLGQVCVDAFKVKERVLNMISKCDNPSAANNYALENGLQNKTIKILNK